jgi:hypothetical protein
MAGPGKFAALAWLALEVGCAISAGGIVAASSGNAPVLGGPIAEALLYLPADFRAIAGLEWTRVGTADALWRTGLLAGYSSPPDRRSRFGWETTARVGYQRGWDGSTTASGGFGGARAAALYRLGRSAEPWQGDALVEVMPMLVFDIAMNGLTRPGGQLQPEFNARLMLRLHLSSTVVP